MQVLLHHGIDGLWIAEVPALPGCNTQGKTREEAIANIKEAIELYREDSDGNVSQALEFDGELVEV